MNLLKLILLFVFLSPVVALGQVKSYIIDLEFFPENAQMWNYPVSNTSFVRGNSELEISENSNEKLTFYLHSEFKIDSIIVGNNAVDYKSEKVMVSYSYNLLALKTTLNATDIIDNKLQIYYSGFMNPSKVRSLSDYMHIESSSGVFLRSYGYSLWFPIVVKENQEAYASIFKKVSVTTPNTFTTVINGELTTILTKNDGKRITTIWKPGVKNISDLQITSRPYSKLTNNLTNIYYLKEEAKAQRILNFTKHLKEFYAQSFKEIDDNVDLHILEMPEYGNISSGNVIGISNDVFKNFDKSLHSKMTIAHELVHPYVNIETSTDSRFTAFVKEGFPSYFHLYSLRNLLNSEEFNLHNYMQTVEKSYLNKIETNKDFRGNNLPKNKAILSISRDEIGDYKDRFILSDRVRLFFYHLETNMGHKKFKLFLKELFQLKHVNYLNFEALILQYIPSYKKNLNLWLHTIEYPKHLHINKN